MMPARWGSGDMTDWQSAHIKFMDEVERANRGAYRPSTGSGPVLRLGSSDIPGAGGGAELESRYRAFCDVADCAAERGVGLEIVGGGHGCFVLELSAHGEAAAVESLLADQRFLDRADEFGADRIALTGVPAGRTLTSCYEFVLPFATCRDKLSDAGDPLASFGTQWSQDIHSGTLSVRIPAAELRRVTSRPRRWLEWLGFADIGRRKLHIQGTALKPIPLPDLQSSVRRLGRNGALVQIHGFANDFRTAVRNAVAFAHNAEIDKLEVAPVLFSWPSAGRLARYDLDTVSAQISGSAIVKVLSAISDSDYRVDVLAHSHGNKLLLDALTDVVSLSIADETLDRAILVAPDIDAVLLETKLESFLRTFGSASLYFSSRDLALQLSQRKFGNRVKAGQGAVAGSTKLECIDASDAATSLTGHSYYNDSPAVLSDLYDTIAGIPAEKRKGREREGAVWKLATRAVLKA